MSQQINRRKYEMNPSLDHLMSTIRVIRSGIDELKATHKKMLLVHAVELLPFLTEMEVQSIKLAEHICRIQEDIDEEKDAKESKEWDR